MMKKGVQRADLVYRVQIAVSGLGEMGRLTMANSEVWKELDRHHRIDCERVGECGDTAQWVTAQGNLFVCNHHRRVFDRQRLVDLEIVQNADLEAA